MSDIHLLSDEVINKIAAGEVVERPASVVKELVENAIDAQARTIKVELSDGGKKLITVSDDGGGIAKKYAALSIKRHATSKIQKINDLFQVNSMGFRGEALASIAAVSKLTIISATEHKEAFKLTYSDDKGQTIDPWQREQGTTISISELFYNVAVRSKFLKSSATELAYVIELLQAIAFTNPHITFTLIHNQREKLFAPACSNNTLDKDSLWGEKILRRRSSQIFNSDMVNSLIYCTEYDNNSRMEALISSPGSQRASSKFLLTCINNRWVRERTLRYGVLRGYHSHLPKGQYPIALLQCHTDPSLVDVNVHPAKTEVRLQYADDMQGLIARAIRRKIRQADWTNNNQNNIVQDSNEEQTTAPFTHNNNSLQTTNNYFTAKDVKKSTTSTPIMTTQNLVTTPIVPKVRTQIRPIANNNLLSLTQNNSPKIGAQEQTDHFKQSDLNWSQLEYKGTLFACYWLLQQDKDVIAVDQHAFHERIIYEQLAKNNQLRQQSQPLIVAECIALSSSQVAFLSEKKAQMQHYGFNYKSISESEIEVTAIPSLLINKNISSLFSVLSQHAIDHGHNVVQHHTLATIACHSAVRSGQELDHDEIKRLIKQAHGVDFYHNCPHGRRVFHRLHKATVEKWFDR